MNTHPLHVTIPDPDDPSGCPAYDGPDCDAWQRLVTGAYRGTSNDEDVLLEVVNNGRRGFSFLSLQRRYTVTLSIVAATSEEVNLILDDLDQVMPSGISIQHFTLREES